MSYNFVNKPLVVNDIEDVVDYYNKINPNLAISFLDRLKEAKAYILKYPKAFQIKYKNVRTILLKQFPYHIHYIVDDINKQIVVLAIIHAYKNPSDYSSRL